MAASSGLVFATTNGDPDKRYLIETVGSGLGILDYDGDGLFDVFFANGSSVARVVAGKPAAGGGLFRNAGGGRFVDVTRLAQIGAPVWAGGVAVADYDNDGWPDVFVSGLGRNVLYHNRGDGSFDEVAAAAGIERSAGAFATGCSFGDLNGDGHLDLYLARYVRFDPTKLPSTACKWKGLSVACGPLGLAPALDSLYMGQGDGTFVEVTLPIAASYGFMPLMVDSDGDGDLDIFVSNDTAGNFLLRNDGAGRWVDVGLVSGIAFNGDGRAQASMGADAADLDDDGRPEIFVTNFSHDSNTLYAGDEGDVFRDETAVAGLLQSSLLQLGWAANFVDDDGDGDLDLVVVNGHVYPQVDGSDLATEYAQPTQLFRNRGRGRFREDRGIGALGDPRAGRSLAVVDYDDDGDPDFVITQADGPVALLRNDRPSRSWIGLRLVATGGDRDAIGAVAFLSCAGRTASRVHRPQAGYLASQDPRLLFGLVAGAAKCEAVVVWPGRGREGFAELAAGQYHVLQEGRGR